jgi:hypothetical protein
MVEIINATLAPLLEHPGVNREGRLTEAKVVKIIERNKPL